MRATINNIKIVIFILDHIIYFPSVKMGKKVYIKLLMEFFEYLINNAKDAYIFNWNEQVTQSMAH